jgi:ABC-type nitrate/sulfonate/bicarbonate transport system permease component
MARVAGSAALAAPSQSSSLAVRVVRYGARIAARSFTIVLLLLIWEALASSGIVSRFMLPPIGPVIERIIEQVGSGEFFVEAARTLSRALAGFAVAGLAGTALGMLMVRNAVARWFFEPVISAGFPIPKVAFLPIFILWFGVYDVSKIMMIIVDAVFPVITATIVGLRSVEREIIWSARNMGATGRQVLWQVMLPAALPQILTGLQVALPIAIIIAIATEMLMGGVGLGGAMLEASRSADSVGVFAGLVETTAVGYAAIKVMALVRRRLLLWHQETQRPTGI